MGIDIASPGANEAALKAALAALTGHELLASGVVTEPVVCIQLGLPLGFSRFILNISNFAGASNATPDYIEFAYQISIDGGNTYLTDETDYDFRGFQANTNAGTVAAFSGTDLSGFFSEFKISDAHPAALNAGVNGQFQFSPGNSSYPFVGLSEFTSRVTSTGDFAINKVQNTLVAADGVVRATNIQIAFYFSTWLDSTITEGTYSLIGVK